MKPQDALDFFVTKAKIAEVCNISDTAVGHWFKQGWIHYDKQCVLEKASDAKVTASWLDVPEDKRPANLQQAA